MYKIFILFIAFTGLSEFGNFSTSESNMEQAIDLHVASLYAIISEQSDVHYPVMDLSTSYLDKCLLYDRIIIDVFSETMDASKVRFDKTVA